MTDRKTIDQITSNELDQLYEQLAAEEADNATLRRQLLHCSHREARDRAEAAINRVRALESGLWQVDDQRDMKVSAVCHSVANGLRAALDEPTPGPDTTATQATDSPERCCVCGGGGPVTYHNYREQPFCWPCADCRCNQDVCVRTGINDPAVSDAAQQRDQLAGVLSEILLVFHPVSSHNGVRIGWTAPHPIHPDDMDRWTAALPKEPTP